MKHCITIICALFSIATSNSMVAENYSTMATVTKKEGLYLLEVQVSRLVETEGKINEQLVAKPRMEWGSGTDSVLLRQGPKPSDEEFLTKENVTLEILCLETEEQQIAKCILLVKLGKKIVSKSTLLISLTD